MGRWDEAIAAAKKAIRIRPGGVAEESADREETIAGAACRLGAYSRLLPGGKKPGRGIEA